MSNEIIEFYKKAIDEKNNTVKDEDVVLEKDEVLESLSATNDPFKNFLLELTDKLKDTKIEESEKLNVINEVIDEEKKELEIKEPSEEKDVFGSFLNDFSDIVGKQIKEKEEEVKNTAINFIEKLKTEKPKNSKKKSKQPSKILNKIKIVEELEKKSETNKPVADDKNTYVDQLQSIDKSDNITQKVKEKSDLKSLVAKQVKDELEKFKVQFSKLAIEGGGGSVAVQYAKGGTMDGDLNVTGKFLSGGKDLSSIFSTASGGGISETDRLISGPSSLILNPDGSLVFPDENTIRPPDDENLTLQSENPELSAYTKIVLSPYAFFAYDSQGNSITFDKVENSIVLTSQDEYEWTFNNEGILVGPNNTLTTTSLSSLGEILSGGKNLSDIFLTAETDAQTLFWNSTAYELSISNGNTISLSSLSAVPSLGREDVNTLVIENSGNWNTAYNIGTAYQAISSTFLTSETDSQTLTFTESSAELSISNGNIVSLSSLKDYETAFNQSSAKYENVYTTVESNSANWTDLTTFNTPSSYPYTLTLTDRSKMMLVDSLSTTNVLVPNDTTYNLPIGAEIKITAMGTGYVDIIAESGVSIKREGSTFGTGISNRITNQYLTTSILKLSANTWLMGGNVVSVYNSPLGIPGVELWLDAADNTTLFDAVIGGSTPAGNGTIARWEDKSSNANHATQSVVNSRPIRLISELNGLDGIDFDGTDDRFIVSSPVTDGPLTVFCVMKVDVITSGFQRMLHMFGPTATHNFMLMVSNAGAYLTRDQRGQVDSYAINKTWGTVSVNTPYILTAIFKETPQNVSGYINNLLGTGTDISGGNSVGAGPPTIIGARSDLLTSTHFSGKLFELIVYNKELNEAEKNGIYAYLAEKWY